VTISNELSCFFWTQPKPLLLADYTLLFHTSHVMEHLECVKEYGTNKQETVRDNA